jgi:uncharacterized protein CbrC (UPF0167 family)
VAGDLGGGGEVGAGSSTEPLPVFRYHPDPQATKSIEASSAACTSCRRVRGFVYVGPTYSSEEDFEPICPWCIADGSASNRFEAEFTDVGVDVPDDVPASVLEELSRRTPGYSAWQAEHWLFHCGDGCAFLGAVGREQLEEHPDALEMVRDGQREYDWPDDVVDDYIDSLSADDSPSAYLFRCLGCGAHLAYSDFL